MLRPVLVATLVCTVTIVHGTTYYVRQTTGDDARDGKSPATAWEHAAKLSSALRAGDTGYVGPGLYREQIDVQYPGTAEAPITIIGDASGRQTGDPPGPVLLTGAEPFDETAFRPGSGPGVYVASAPEYRVWGVVEMDGPQRRYLRAGITREHRVEDEPETAVVIDRRGSYTYDTHTGELVIHTSDDRPPVAHEIELIRRGGGVTMFGKPHVRVLGFTIRHTQDAGINFFKGSDGGLAAGNVVWGGRQGVRVYGSTAVTLEGNVLFRNENSGAYFAAASTGATVVGNVIAENLKGLRWSSGSSGATVLDNRAFGNDERGISVEHSDQVILRQNVLAGNRVSELLSQQSVLASDDNCFDPDAAGGLVVDLSPFPPGTAFPRLAEYQARYHQDLGSRQGGCGPLPILPDVARLHAESLSYLGRARQVLRGEPAEPGVLRRWLTRLLPTAR